MNADTQQALNLISQGLASVQGTLEIHKNLQQALQIVTKALEPATVETAKEEATEQ